MDRALVKKLIAGASLITPTRRLASDCQTRIARFFPRQRGVWESLAIDSLEDWYKKRWHQYEMSGTVNEYLLTETQSLLACEMILQTSEVGKTIFNTYETAKLIYRAWTILHQWRSLDLLEKEGDSIDCQAFSTWITQYRRCLEEHHYIDEASLPTRLLALLQVAPSEDCLFYGFEEKTPFLEHFIEILQSAGWNIEEQASTTVEKKATVARAAYIDEHQEHRAAVQFALLQHRQGKKNIAIVVPDLADKRHALEALLRTAFQPMAIAFPLWEVDTRFNISAAIPLIEYPLVHAAMKGLRLGMSHFSVADYQGVLDSSWFFSPNDTEHYLHLNEVKQHLHGRLNRLTVLTMMKNTTEKPVAWEKRFTVFHQTVSHFAPLQSYSAWAEGFRVLLGALQWPINQALSSIEYQSIVRFEKLLQALGEADAVLPPCDYRQALETLEKLASYIPFQPENRGAQVQVLGILEAAGQCFDAMWIMGMNNEAWPPMAQHNPFIDLTAQRERHMPHSSAEREMQYAIKMTQRFKQSANTVIFSYALQSKEKKWEGSELIRSLPLRVLPDIQEIFGSPASDAEYIDWVDENAPPVLKINSVHASARLVECQSACPFRAFAEYRLGATSTSPDSPWLSPSDQGTLLHHILEQWWKHYPSQSSLVAMSEATQDAEIKRLIQEGLLGPRFRSLSVVCYEAEYARLFIILKDYLKMESQREYFKVIHTEYRTFFSLEDMRFSLRCDRIEQEESGATYIVDYKTGQFSLSEWEGARLISPQIPLYALAYEDPALNGVKVIHLSLEKMEYKIKCDQDFHDSRIKWKFHIGELVKAFNEGVATVDPRNGKATCQFCHLSALCRVQEREYAE